MRGVVQEIKRFTKNTVVTVDGVGYSIFNNKLKVDIQVGDTIEFDAIKKGNYNNMENVRKVAGQQQAQASAGGNSISNDAKQLLIVRQSSLKEALNTLVAQGNKKFTTADVLLLTDEYVDYVMEGLPEELAIQKEMAAINSGSDEDPIG